MSRYEIYKPSGIDWIGDVPEHWEVKRLKNLATNVSTKSQEITDDDFLVALENIESNTGLFIESSTEYENNGIAFKKSHLLYNKLRPYLNKVYLAERNGICVGDIIVVECSKKLLPKFLQYKMLSDAFCSIVMSSVQGTKMPRTSWEFISSLKFGIPTPNEQLAIANYLDDQTQNIDRLIANKKAQAEKLKELRQIEINNAVTKGLNPNTEMKDSGIEWLGKIPKHWEVNRLKNTTFVNQSVISEKTAPDYLIKYIDISNVNSMGEFIELQEMEFSEAPSRARRIPKHNSILLSTVRTYLRAIALVQNPDENLIASTGFAVIDANQNLFDASYLYFQMISHILVERVIANSEGVSYPAISSTKLGDIKIVIPTKKEQTEIARYLQKRTTAIDQLIKNIEAQIEKLQELRKIKIYEAVTGKIKVNAYAETTA